MIHNIINKRTGEVISEEARVADSFFKRFLGLMSRESMSDEEALVFYGTNSIHTCFMRFAIDVVLLDNQMRVCKIYHALVPWRVGGSLKAKTVIEFPAHRLSQKNVKLGDTILIELSNALIDNK